MLASVVFAAALAVTPCDNVNDSAFSWRECMAEYNERVELELGQAWRRVLRKAEDDDSKRVDEKWHRDERGQTGRLKDSQKTWLIYRRDQCEVETYPMFGGTGVIGLELSCLVRINRARTAELIAFLRNE